MEATRGITSRAVLRSMAKDVLVARQLYAAQKDEMDRERDAFEKAHVHLSERNKLTAEALVICETRLREYAVSIYEQTGDKHPGDGVNIRVLTKLQYDATEALKWAKHHDVAVVLDKMTFEKIAKVTPPDFVEIVVEHQATIATDLEKALKE